VLAIEACLLEKPSVKPNILFLLAGMLLKGSSALAATHFVDANSGNPIAPYTNWATAARVIQDAVDAACAGDQVLVGNGTYASGGRAVGTNALLNRVAVEEPIAVMSVNGAAPATARR
jgi:hypothetical protein